MLQCSHLQVLVGTALAAATILGLVLRASGFSPRVPLAELRASLRYGLTGHLQSVLANAHLRIDVLMLAALLQDPSAVAVYTIAATIVNRVRVIPAAIAIAVFPSFAEADASEAARLTARVLRHSTFVVTLSVLALVPAMIWLVPLLFGSAYEASVPLALVPLPGAALLSVQAIVGRYFAARNLQRVNVLCSALGLALNVVANSVLIPSLGALGAALASLGSYSVVAVVALVWFSRHSGVAMRDAVWVRASDLRDYQSAAARALARLRSSS